MAERRGRSDSRRALRVELRVETSEPKAGQVVRNDIVCSAPALSGAFSSEASSDATKELTSPQPSPTGEGVWSPPLRGVHPEGRIKVGLLFDSDAELLDLTPA